MDIENLYLSIKDNKTELNSDNINEKDDHGLTLLHVAAKNDDLEFIKELLIRGAIYNCKDNDGKTPFNLASDLKVLKLLTTVRKFFRAVKDGKLDDIENYVKEDKSIINAKEEDAGTALHWAVNKGRSDVIKFLIDNSADVFQVTNKGNSTLHIAVINENMDIVNLLLQHIPVDYSASYVNIQTFKTKTSCLHIAAENGNFHLVCILLAHGAMYSIENVEGDTPCNVSSNIVKKFLLKTNDIFVFAKNGDSKLFEELNFLDCQSFEAVSHARNCNRNTIRDLISLHNKDFIEKLSDVFRVHEKRNEEKLGWKVWELKALKRKVDAHLQYSNTYINFLYVDRSSTLNSNPRRHLKEGSCFLNNAYNVVKQYKALRPGIIEDYNIKMIKDTLDELQFDPNHMTYSNTENFSQSKAIYVDSSVKETKYYKLLHGKLNKDVNIFVGMIMHQIEIPVKNLLKFIDEKLLCFPNYQLIKGIQENSISRIDVSLQMGADINFEDDDHETPLLCVVYNGNTIVLKKILESGADIRHIYHGGDSVLHVFMSKSHRHEDHVEMTKCLLEYGAVYNSKNQKGEIPFDKSNCKSCKHVLKMVETCFQTAENDQNSLLEKLKTLETSDFNAVTQARNACGNTLLQVAFSSGDEFGNQLLKMVKSTQPSETSLEVKALLEKKFLGIKKLAEKLVNAAEVYLPILCFLSEPRDSEKNQYPWKTLMEGSCYLYYAYKLVQEYDEFMGLRRNEDIAAIEKTLQRLQFDPKHLSGSLKEGISKDDELFVSNAQGTEYYYKLLHNENKKYIKEFIELVSTSIHNPAENFLKYSKLSDENM